MKSKAEKQTGINIAGTSPEDAVCFSTCMKASKILKKGHQKLELPKKNTAHKNHQGTENYSDESGLKASSIFRGNENYGACAIVGGSPNCFSNSGVTPFAVIPCMILIGSRALSNAVLMIVMAIATLFLPFFVIFPKVIFLKRTAFLIFCSAKLFVGLIVSGYLRNTKSSFLNVIKRFRILSDSWCDNGGYWYNFLNLLMISFLPERNSSEVKAEC